jgi:hypothetical protein
MKVKSLFDLLQTSSELLTYFDGVTTPEQLVSRLERLKKAEPDELASLITDLDSLRQSVSASFNDTLEMGRDSSEITEEDGDDDEFFDLEDPSEADIQSLMADSEDENVKVDGDVKD